MNTNLLAFNITTTLYLILGSMHERSRLRRVYGAPYERYLNSGVPFYLPMPRRNPFARTTTLAGLNTADDRLMP